MDHRVNSTTQLLPNNIVSDPLSLSPLPSLHASVEELILRSAPVKHFQGSCRASSPFRPAAECVRITLTELAILDCLTQRGTALNLKVCVAGGGA